MTYKKNNKVMIINFSEYIVEKMGILTSLGKIADELIDSFKKSDKFIFETEIENIHIILNCEYKKIKGKTDAKITHLHDNVFSFIIFNINRSNIIHELKHAHYDRVTKGYADKYNLISHISRTILDYKFKYINKTPETLYDIFYYTNPNEFEAYFNSMYEELLELTKNKLNKREIITKYLNNTMLYVIFKFYYKNEFDITEYFYNNTFLSEYLDEYIRILTDFKNKGETNIDNNNFFKSQLKKLIEIFKHNKKLLTTDQNKTLNYINKSINDTVKKNYKKIFRLYSLILDDSLKINESKINIKSFDYEAIKMNYKGLPILYVTSYKIIKDNGEKVTCNVNGYEYTDIEFDTVIKKGWTNVINKTVILDKTDFNSGTTKRKIYTL